MTGLLDNTGAGSWYYGSFLGGDTWEAPGLFKSGAKMWRRVAIYTTVLTAPPTAKNLLIYYKAKFNKDPNALLPWVMMPGYSGCH